MKIQFSVAAGIAALSLSVPMVARAADPPAAPTGSLVSLAANAARCAVVTADNAIEVRDGSQPLSTPPLTRISGPRDRILAVTITTDGAYVAAACADRKVYIWNVGTRKKIAILDEPQNSPTHASASAASDVTSLAFNREGTELALVDHGYGLIARYLGADASDMRFGSAFYTSAPIRGITSDNRGAWIGGDDDGRLHFFDWSNREIAVTGSKVAGSIDALAMSPDGNHLATGGNDDEVKIWSVPGGAIGAASHPDLVTLQDRHPAGAVITSIAFRADGQTIAFASGGSDLGLWQRATPAPGAVAAAPPVAVVTTPTTPIITPTAISPTPTQPIATTAPANPANPAQPATVTPAAPEQPAAVPPAAPVATAATPPAAAPARKATAVRVGTASAASMPAPIHVHLNVARLSRLVGHSEYVNDIAFSPDGHTLASVSRDKTIRLWDVADGSQKAILGKHDAFASAVAFSPNGKMLASGGWDDKIKLFDLTTGAEAKTDGRLDKHSSYVLSLDFSPDGARLASGSNDRTARVFDVATGASRVSAALPDAVATVSFSPDGTRLAGGCLDGGVYLWDASTMHLLRSFKPASDARPVFAVAFLDNNTIAAGGKAGSLRVWSLRGGLVATLQAGKEDVYGLAFDAPKGLLAAGGTDKLIRFWSVDKLRAAHNSRVAPMLTQAGHTNTVRALAFSADGTMLASGGWDYNILLWSVAENSGLAENVGR